jgi:hypothetical protein
VKTDVVLPGVEAAPLLRVLQGDYRGWFDLGNVKTERATVRIVV